MSDRKTMQLQPDGIVQLLPMRTTRVISNGRRLRRRPAILALQLSCPKMKRGSMRLISDIHAAQLRVFPLPISSSSPRESSFDP